MKLNLLVVLLIAAALFAPASAFAAGKDAGRVLENGHEVSPEMMTLPATTDGILAIQGCPSCKRINFNFAPTARFFIEADEVSFAELKNHLRVVPNASVLVVTPISQSTVTRIKVSRTAAR